MGTGESELRPNMTISRSACSVLVGMPVDGPARWTSTITRGSSTMTARFNASDLSAMPGPEEAVIPMAPPYDAPMAEPIAAISSSAWNVLTPKFLYVASWWRMSLAGVMGYEPYTSSRLASWDAATKPIAAASLPVMFR